jgi:hypothetical protein
MTKISCLLLFFLFTLYSNSQAQTPHNLIGQYTFVQSIMIQPAKSDGTTLKNGTTDWPQIPSEVNQKFKVLSTTTSKAIIQVLDYTKKNDSTTINRKVIPTPKFYLYNFKGSKAAYDSLSFETTNARSYGEKQLYFTVDTSFIADPNIATKQTKVGGSLALGVINFPFKYRPQRGNGDFSGALNFGVGIGYTIPHKTWRQFTWSIISGYSFSNVVLDSSNTSKNQGSLSSSNNYSAFSFSIGLLTQYQQIQAGVFLGWDRISNINQREFGWSYQGKPWISVGFGFAIFSIQNKTTNNSSSSQQ